MKLHPYFGAFEIYTDNAFRTNTGKEQEFTHVLAPGIQAALPFMGKHRFLFDYGYTKRINQRFSRNDVETMDANGQLTLNLPKSIKIDLQGGHSRGFDQRGSVFDTQSFEPNRWITNSLLGRMEVFGSWAGVRLTGRRTELRFLNNNQGITRDRTTSITDLTLFGSVAPKTYVLAGLHLTDQSYDRNKQLDSFSVRLTSGLRWEIAGKTDGEIRGGYEILNFDRAPVPQSGPGLSQGGDKRENFFFGGYLRWRPTSRIEIYLTPSRSIQQTVVVDSNSFTQTLVNLNVNYAVTVRTQVSSSLGYSNNRFSNPITLDGATKQRDDNTISAGIGLNYQVLEWLGFRANYQYQKRKSSFSRFDFSANSMIFSMEVLF